MSYSPNFYGILSTGSSASLAADYTNAEGSTIPFCTPVSSNTSGNIVFTDVTSEANIQAFVGLTTVSLAPAALGLVISDGRLTNIPSALGFTIGQAIYLGNIPGTLTNIKPDSTISGWNPGDWVVLVGVVLKNQQNSLNQDIQLFRQIIGQL